MDLQGDSSDGSKKSKVGFAKSKVISLGSRSSSSSKNFVLSGKIFFEK